MKPAKQKQPKKTLSELCQERITTIHDARREKEAAEQKARHRREEDEVCAQMYGPNWRHRKLPWESSHQQSQNDSTKTGGHLEVPESDIHLASEDEYDDFPDTDARMRDRKERLAS